MAAAALGWALLSFCKVIGLVCKGIFWLIFGEKCTAVISGIQSREGNYKNSKVWDRYTCDLAVSSREGEREATLQILVDTRKGTPPEIGDRLQLRYREKTGTCCDMHRILKRIAMETGIIAACIAIYFACIFAAELL